MRRLSIFFILLLVSGSSVRAQKNSDSQLLTQNSALLRALTDKVNAASSRRTQKSVGVQDVTEEQWDEFIYCFAKVYVTNKYGSRSGSSLLISYNGWFITAAHVVEVEGIDFNRSYIMHEGNTYPLRFVQIDRTHDVALVKVSMEGQPVLREVSFGVARLNDRVHLLSELGSRTNISTGAITFENMPTTDLGKDGIVSDTFVSSIYTKDGFSGSPIFNINGELIGIGSYGAVKINTTTPTGYSLKNNIDENRLNLSSGGAKIKYLASVANLALRAITDDYNNKKSLGYLM